MRRASIHAYEEEMLRLVGPEELADLQAGDLLQTSDANLVLAIARDIRKNRTQWKGLRHLPENAGLSWMIILGGKPPSWFFDCSAI